MKIFKCIVVGAGSISREFALRHFIKDVSCEVIGVVDTQIELARSLAKDIALLKLGGKVTGTKYRETVELELTEGEEGVRDYFDSVKCSDNLTHILQAIGDEVDIVYIGTPPNTHAELCLLALNARKHVVLEKPIAVSSIDTDNIVSYDEEAGKNNTFVSIDIGMRYNSALQYLKETMKNNETFGKIISIKLKLHFMQWPREWQKQPWVAERNQGGPLLEVGTHYLFAICELLGFDTFINSSCQVTYPDDPVNGVLCESSCIGQLHFEEGYIVDIDICSHSEEAKLKGSDIYELEVIGSNASYNLYNFTRLLDMKENKDILIGEYGRKDCILELIAMIEGKQSTRIVTPRQAQSVQRIISSIKQNL